MPQKSSGEIAYDRMLAAIRGGVFAPGDRLREEDVADRLQISRTPVREALRRLEADRIVEHKPRVGAVVRELSHAEVVELYEMRVVFERTAAELAAKHGLAAEFDALDALNKQLATENGNPAHAASINQEFHQGLYLACRNRFLLEAARAVNNALFLLGPTTFTDEARIAQVVDQHHAIIAGLRAGDAAAAGEAAEVHLTTSLRRRLKGPA